MYFKQNLKELLDSRKMKIADFARELNISPQRAGKYVNGHNQPKFEVLAEISELFDIAIDDLLLVDLTKPGATSRPFGAGVESAKTLDEQEALTIKLLMQRVNELEREMKRSDPELAKDLGIE